MTECNRDEQALHLLRTLMKVEDLEARRVIIVLTEAAARGASVKIEAIGSALGQERLLTN